MPTDRPDQRAAHGGHTAPSAQEVDDVAATVVGFARTLRAAGVRAGTDRLQAFVDALASMDVARRDNVYWAGRVTLCGHHDDIGVYDRAFAAYFAGEDPLGRARRRGPTAQAADRRGVVVGGPSAEGAPDGAAIAASASRTEVLRTADLGRLTDRERREVRQLIAQLAVPHDRRRTRRFQSAPRGVVDRAATVRAVLRSHGELDRVRYRRPQTRPRRLVVLVDVSGSMEPYAEALIRFAHAARQRGAPTEVFSVGTRLTRLTDELGHRDPDRAMAAVGGRVADWSGGTRLGDLLKEWLDVWGQRGMARGATVVILSDGWERGDPAALGRQMARLARLAHRVVWSNPLRARPGFAPVAGGMAAALPHVDDFVDGHSVAAFERLARIIADPGPSGRRRRPKSGAMVEWPSLTGQE